MGLDSEPFYTGLCTARPPPTPEEFTLDMIAEVEGWRMERLLSEPPPQYDLPPRARQSRVSPLPEVPPSPSPLPCTVESVFFEALTDG